MAPGNPLPLFVVVDFPRSNFPEERICFPDLPRTHVAMAVIHEHCQSRKCCSMSTIPLRLCITITENNSQWLECDLVADKLLSIGSLKGDKNACKFQVKRRNKNLVCINRGLKNSIEIQIHHSVLLRVVAISFWTGIAQLLVKIQQFNLLLRVLLFFISGNA